MSTTATTGSYRGWEIVTLESRRLRVIVVPGKGGDILSISRRSDGLELLWRSPWGLRERGSETVGSSSDARLMSNYPGGWQSVFPNGGNAAVEHGVEWGMHGEVWLTGFEYDVTLDGLDLSARLVLSPFRVEKQVTLEDDTVRVTETITNEGGVPIEAMWSHHPAFGAPFLSADCVLETAAHRITVDPQRRTPTGDLRPGAVSDWPTASGLRGAVDLRTVPAPGSAVDRFAYLGAFDTGYVALRNPRLDAGVELRWDAAALPHAWYWLEANATEGFPWYRSAYVLGLEPASTIPGLGIAEARRRGADLVPFEPGQTRTVTVRLAVTGGAPRP